MGKRRRVPGRDRAGRWELFTKLPANFRAACLLAGLFGMGMGPRTATASSPGLYQSTFLGTKVQAEPRSRVCLQQLSARLWAGAGLWAWVYVPGDGRVKHGWSWDAHIRGQRWGTQREQLCHTVMSALVAQSAVVAPGGSWRDRASSLIPPPLSSACCSTAPSVQPLARH